MLISINISRNIKKYSIFIGSDEPRMLFFLLINVTLPTIFVMCPFMSRQIFMLSRFECIFYNLGASFRSRSAFLRKQEVHYHESF